MPPVVSCPAAPWSGAPGWASGPRRPPSPRSPGCCRRARRRCPRCRRAEPHHRTPFEQAEMTDQTAQYKQQQYPCASCGARLTFAAGTTALKCPYCGFEQQVVADETREVREHSFDQWLAGAQDKPATQIAAHTVTCTGCGARSETDKLSDLCPFCGAAIVVEPDADVMITPEAVLPFAITSAKAMDLFQDWVKSRWFAPGSLKSLAAREGIQGTYLPYWTYDSD